MEKLLFVFITIFYILFIVFELYTMVRSYQKAGIAGWKALIPIMNIVSLFPLANLSTWMLFLIFVPIINIYIIYQVYAALADRLGKQRIFALGLLFLPIVFFPILAFKREKKEIQEEKKNATTEDFMDGPITPLEARPDLDEIYATSKEMKEEEPQKEIESIPISDVQNIEKVQYIEEEKKPLNLDEYTMCPQCGTKLDIQATTCFLCGMELHQK